MEGFKRSMKYQFMESKAFVLKFWATVLGLNILFYILMNIGADSIRIGVSKYVTETELLVSVVGVNLLIIAISLIPYNYERNYESFPLAISLGMTRRNYFISFLLDNIFIAFIFATIQGILMKIDPFFVKLIGKVPLYDLEYFNTKTDNMFYIILILFVFFLGFICFWSLIASLNYKFGYMIWVIAVVLNLGISTLNINILADILKSIGNILSPRLGINEIGIIFSAIGISYLINYLIVSKTDIKRKAG